MSWRTIVLANRAKVDLQLGYMVVRGEDVTKILIDEISTVIVESTEVSFTAALIAELIANKVKLVFCDNKRNPCCELMPCYGSHDSSAKIRQQVTWSNLEKGETGTAILRQKIRMQAKLLQRLDIETYVMLNKYAEEITFRDGTNREGHAAKVYFNSIFGNKFSRADDNMVNAALNYGYTILLSTINREIVANGYITQIGFIHDNVFNQFNLGSDIMEPLRPFVDHKVITMLWNEELIEFGKEQKHILLEFLAERVMVEDRSYNLDYAIKLYVRSVFDAINDNDISKIKWCDFCEEQ